MGLYVLMNMIMDKQEYDQGLHVFEDFALTELEHWFNTTKDLLIRFGPHPFYHSGKTYQSSAILDNDTLTLTFSSQKTHIGKRSSQITNFSQCDYHRFQQLTNPHTREHAFSKWLKVKAEKDSDYIDSKKDCAMAAGSKIVSLLSPYINTSPTSMLRLYREDEYYYAKTTSNSIEIYHVPSRNQLKSPLIIRNIEAKVPAHQLNIHTTIENKDSGKMIEFRNELRYTHGQFHSTPEAKFYVAGGDMTALFKELYVGP